MGALIVHGTGLLALFTLLSTFDHYERYSLQIFSLWWLTWDIFGQFSILLTNTWFCRVGGDPVAFPLITATILLYSSICFLGVSQVKTCFRSFSSWSFDSWYFYSGVPFICWVVLRIVQATLLAGIQTMFVLVKLRLYLRPLPNSSMSPFFETFLTTDDIFWHVLQDVIQITIKYDKQSFVFDNISRKAGCRDLFSLFK